MRRFAWILALASVIALGAWAFIKYRKTSGITVFADDKVRFKLPTGQILLADFDSNPFAKSEMAVGIGFINESNSPMSFSIEDVDYCDKDGNCFETIKLGNPSLLKDSGPEPTDPGPEARSILSGGKFEVIDSRKGVLELDSAGGNDLPLVALGGAKRVEISSDFQVVDVQHASH